MKIIDEKGKLFGAINLFDLIVLFSILFSAAFIYRWINVARDPSWTNFETVHVKCKAYAFLPNYMADFFEEGDYMIDDEGKKVVIIEKILSKEPYPPPGQEYYVSKDGDRAYLDTGMIRLRTKDGETLYTKPATSLEKRHGMKEVVFIMDIVGYRKKGIVYSCINNIPIRMGYSFNFDTEKYGTVAIVLQIMGER